MASNLENLKASVAVVIPTLNRHHLLRELLSELVNQEVAPEQVIVVDASDKPFKMNSCQGRIKVISSSIRSAAVQRNLGIQQLKESDAKIEFIAFLDDDVKPSPSYLRLLCQALIENPDAVGVSGLAIGTNEKPRRKSNILKILKLIGGEGSLSPAGVNIPIRNNKGITEAEWLIGCSLWRYSMINDLQFEADFDGQSVFEDVIFSMRAARRGRLLVDPQVRFDHLLAVESRPNSFQHYRSWVRNRYRLKTIFPEKIDIWRFVTFNALMLLSLTVRAHFSGALGIVFGSYDLLRKR